MDKINDQPCINGLLLIYLELVLDLCIGLHIIDCIGDINVDFLKIFVWRSYFLYKLEDLFDGFFQINEKPYCSN